jgi:hypothetical protein
MKALATFWSPNSFFDLIFGVTVYVTGVYYKFLCVYCGITFSSDRARSWKFLFYEFNQIFIRVIYYYKLPSLSLEEFIFSDI